MEPFAIIGRLFDWLRSKHVYRPITVRFELPDFQRLSLELDLKGEGERRGRDELPKSEAVSLDEVEERIVAAIERFKTSAYETYTENRDAYFAALRALVSRPLQARVLTTPDDAAADFETRGREASDELDGLQQFVINISRELEDFKRQTRLDRTPDYPDSRVFHWGLIALLILFEAVANTFFFAQGSDFGFAGGFVLALLAAAANVILGLAAGYQPFRWKNSRFASLKIIGLALTFVYFPLAFLLNLWVAHYRTSLLANPDSATAFHAAMAALTTAPLDIGSFESLMLLIIGLAFSVIAFADGYHLDDPYPGYGKLARRAADYREHFRQTKAQIVADFTESKDRLLGEVDEGATTVERRRLDFREIRGRTETLNRQFKQYLDHLQQTGNQLLKTYRDANELARHTPSPSYFKDQWQMLRPEIDEVSITDTEAFEKENELTVQKLSSARQKIIHTFETAIRGLETIQELTQKKPSDPVAEPTLLESVRKKANG